MYTEQVRNDLEHPYHLRDCFLLVSFLCSLILSSYLSQATQVPRVLARPEMHCRYQSAREIFGSGSNKSLVKGITSLSLRHYML
jgi:hypothetical protein